MKRSFIQFAIVLIILFRVILLSSCANIIPPGGGPKDTLPPKLVMSLPKDSATNVSPKVITLTFDEYVTLQSAQQELIVSPTLKNSPLIDSKLRVVTIKLNRDSFEANTTYSLNFGNAIKDVNEGNIAKGFTYVFSTGNSLDHGIYKGKVILAETGKIDSSLVVMLHNNLSDTAIAKIRPRYYTRLNGKGEFSFRNLPEGVFNVYVLENSFSNRYTDSTEIFAFKNEPVTIGNNTKPDTLFAYQEIKKKEKTATPSFSPIKLPGSNKEDKRVRYTSSLDNGEQDLLSDLVLSFTKKISHFDSTKFVLTDTNYRPLNNYSITLDTGKTKVVLKYSWKDYTPLRLLIAKDAVADSLKTTLSKADTLRFFTKRESDYGSIRLRFGNLDLSKNPVLQIWQNDKLLESVVLTGTEFRRKLFHAGSYDLRILYDKNRNGIWDPGHFFGYKRQPEIVQLIPKALTIRANWDNEVNIPL